MRSFIVCFLLCAAGAAAAATPATKPAKVPAGTAAPAASQPTTAPTRANAAFVADFNEHLIDSKFDDVIAKLRAMGAIGIEPKNPYGPDLGYSWEYASYMFSVDDKGLIFRYQFITPQWPPAPGSDVARHPENKLKPGNKWWLVHRFAKPVPGYGDGRSTLATIQAPTPAAAAAQWVEKMNKDDKISEKMYRDLSHGKPYPLAAIKLEEVEVHEWFAPSLKAQHQER